MTQIPTLRDTVGYDQFHVGDMSLRVTPSDTTSAAWIFCKDRAGNKEAAVLLSAASVLEAVAALSEFTEADGDQVISHLPLDVSISGINDASCKLESLSALATSLQLSVFESHRVTTSLDRLDARRLLNALSTHLLESAASAC